MEKNYKPSRKASITLSLLVTAIPAAAVLYALSTPSVRNKAYFIYTGILLIVLCVFMGAVYIPLWFMKMSIRITDREVIFRSGIVIIAERHMGIHSLELVYIIKTPFSGCTGFNFVSLCVYGKRLVLPFLDICDAEEAADILQKSLAKREEEPYEP